MQMRGHVNSKRPEACHNGCQKPCDQDVAECLASDCVDPFYNTHTQNGADNGLGRGDGDTHEGMLFYPTLRLVSSCVLFLFQETFCELYE